MRDDEAGEVLDAGGAAATEAVVHAAVRSYAGQTPEATWPETLSAAAAGVLAARLDRLAAAVEALAPTAPADALSDPDAGAREGTARRLDAVARLVDVVPLPGHTGHTGDCWASSAPCLAVVLRRVLASGGPAALVDVVLSGTDRAGGGR